jgi:hypothetical protein
LHRSLQLLSVACFVSIASAQIANIRQGTFEAGGFVGSSYGVGAGDVMGGGTISYAVTKGFLPYAEFTYFPSVERTASGPIGNTSNTFSVTYPASGTEFHVGVHYRIPIRESHFAPYGAFGVGSLSIGSGTFQSLSYTAQGSKYTVPLQGSVPAGSTVAINFGGGIRYYMTPRYGIRFEAKGYKPFTGTSTTVGGYGPLTFTNTFLKAEVGFFIQFP